MTAYYNERDPYAAQWLRNLIGAGHIAPGEVDERSITDVSADELAGFTQCHFFAGIAVWSHALRRAGWPDDQPIWTGSCPCQPFSAAGKQQGFADERHLWPVWFNLIQECRPPVILGEQVASALDWLDLVSADMEASGYAFGAADLCAAGFGGAHIRQRLYFAATQGMDHAASARCIGQIGGAEGIARDETRLRMSGEGGDVGRLAHSEQPRLEGYAGHGNYSSQPGRLDAEPIRPATQGSWSGGLADTNQQRSGGRGVCRPDQSVGESEGASLERFEGFCEDSTSHAPMLGRDSVDWLYCRDGKWRPVGPGTFPLADAPASRVGRLRAYGNALDAETASQFIGAVMECLP